ncbi:MAG TPA: choice-of-anchor P family protein, partial [Actinomycetota bacterium]|nr:choice-of-anchor P family protein [Actinomycetota bacterium]
MTHQKATGRRLIIVIACITALLSQFVLPASADVTSVSGGAYGASITSSLLGTVLPPTPSVTLPPGGGGPFTATALPIVIPGVLSVAVLDVLTEGGNLGAHEGFAHSEADVADVVVGSLLGPNLQIQAVHSECLSNGDGSSGLTRLVGVAGAAGFPELPAPNSVVPQADLPAGIAEIR